MCDILDKMVIWVAVLPRVDQLAKVMPNFWRAVYVPPELSDNRYAYWYISAMNEKNVTQQNPVTIKFQVCDSQSVYIQVKGVFA